ncbi:MAG: AtpZ/AtpI family protein [Actinomycetota bacterium]|jgi:F0F1-type ATP synthase assembly protein I
MPGRDQGEAWRGANQAWSAIGTMLAGIVVWGGVGWLLDRWLGFEGLFLPIGMVLGVSVAIWLIYLRYGRNPD